ncbi:MBL fold metallo-hydrolase [Cohnella phaseoli]|uniref:Metallo-beta-lactamase superfamily protein n=1 Tax=Cohnella phaseoli TaxID=456490 RepID=A0A3D9KEF6_9BACL|nr:MBL fold metallo-hydrolase [Cohnella phaseoli]RED84197.1 metallo-beta-lactamase superfamily protein [Cohnella phaseoli]
MELRRITDRVFYTMFSKESDRPTLGYINGEKRSLMVDAGNSKNHLESFNDAVNNEGFRKPGIIAITHWHWDHTFGMHAADGVTIAHQKTNAKLAEMAMWEWTDSEMKKRLAEKVEIEFADTCIRNEYPLLSEIRVVTSDLSFSGFMEIDLGGITAQLHHVASPHSEDSVCVLVPQERVLFIGDAVGLDYYNNCYLDKDKLRSLLTTIEGFDFDTCVVGHAEPVSKQKIVEVMHSLLER